MRTWAALPSPTTVTVIPLSFVMVVLASVGLLQGVDQFVFGVSVMPDLGG